MKDKYSILNITNLPMIDFPASQKVLCEGYVTLKAFTCANIGSQASDSSPVIYKERCASNRAFTNKMCRDLWDYVD